MNLTARIKLRLKKQKNKLIIMYNTFEKASFDQFIVASMAKITKSENVVNKYIDDITGNGSLNSHLKKMFQEVKDFTKENLERILNDSMYPILKIDSSNRYIYYPNLNISTMNDKIYNGNISEDETLPKLLVTEGEFYDSDIELGKETNTSDTYTVHIKDNIVKIQLSPKEIREIDESLFSDIVDVQVNDLSEYQGTVNSDIEGTNWNIMSASKLNDITANSNRSFIYNGDHYQITNTYLKRTKVAEVYGIYIYRENMYYYERRNRKYCELVMQHLINSGEINTFQVKKMIPIIESLNYEDMQNYINHLLDARDIKEMTEIGFNLISKGFKNDWRSGAIRNFKKFMKTDQELIYTYQIYANQISKSNDFSLNQLYRIYKKNRIILSDNDRNTVEEYLNNRNKMIKEMEAIMGEITLSGRRQQVRELEKTKEVKRFRKLGNDLQGHFDNDIKKLSDDMLNQIYQLVLEYQQLDILMVSLLSSKE